MESDKEKAERFWQYIEFLFENGEVSCSDCGQELGKSDLKDNYLDPLCEDCVRALKS